MKFNEVLRASKAIFVSYFKMEMIRESGFFLGLVSMSLWIMLFLLPIMLFREEGTSYSLIATYIFIGICIFQAYSVTSWDFGWSLRLAMFNGVLENILVSGSNILIMFLGMAPVSILWLILSITLSYFVVSILIAPPYIPSINIPFFIISLSILVIVLLAYALLLGGTLIASGTSGAVVEFLSWILPVATGGVTPLSRLPPVLRDFALFTPFSYPAELLRFSLSLEKPILSIEHTVTIGFLFSVTFLALSYLYFKFQLKKLMKVGIKTTSMW